METKTKVFKGCSIKFSITIEKGESIEKLIADGKYETITEKASEIISSLTNNEEETPQVMDIELIEFQNKPDEIDVQKEIIKRGLLFCEDIDALRFGAKYNEIGSLLGKESACSIMFPHEISTHSRKSKAILSIDYRCEKRILSQGGFGTKLFERWFFAGLRPRK